MSLNLREELNKLSNAAPNLRDLDEYSDDETRAKVDEKSKEYEHELDFKTSDGGSRRLRAPIGDLSDYGKRYKGQSISRKQLDQDSDFDEDDIEDEEDVDDDEEMIDNEEDEDDEDDEDEGEDEEEDEDEDEEENDDLEEETSDKKRKFKSNKESDDGLNLMNFNQKEELAKGKAVKYQLNLWDMILEARIKFQNIMNTVNELPQFDNYENVVNSLAIDEKEKHETIQKENQELIVNMFNKLAELQQRLVLNDPETSYMIKDLKLENNSNDEMPEEKEKKNFKRKRANSEGSSEESEDQEEKDDESEEDEEDEEIYSDTDEEIKAEEIKRAKKLKKMSNFNFNPLKSEQFDEYLNNFNKSFQRYRDSTIQKWYDKTRLSSGKSFQALEKPILQQIEHILLDKERIVKRTQLKRSQYKICGKEDNDNEKDLEASKDRHLKDYDPEIFDDQDFYNQLLRDLIDRKSNNISDPVELSRKSIELQKLRSKNKKKVDTKASKGRKIKFEVHKPMINFMAPIFRTTMSDEARNELFRSLFGNDITKISSNNKSFDTDIDFSSIFKKS